MQAEDMIKSLIGVSVTSIKLKRTTVGFIKVISTILKDPEISSEFKIEFLVRKLEELDELGIFEALPEEDKFLNNFDEQPSVTDFINNIKEDIS